MKVSHAKPLCCLVLSLGMLFTVFTVSGVQAGITFPVNDDVAPAQKPLVVKTLESRKAQLSRRFSLDSESVAVSKRLQDNDIVQSGSCGGRCDFASTMIQAFKDHRPVVITPDLIWMMVLLGFSTHINQNPEEYRHLFVDHDGKKPLCIVGADRDPSVLSRQFCDLIEKNIKDEQLAGTLCRPFSTSEDDDITAFHMSLMSTEQEYFDYYVLMSGIPSVTLEGTPEDWRDLKERFDYLRKYDLEWWVDALSPVLEKIEMTASCNDPGEVDKTFWRGIVKYYTHGEGSGSVPELNGWITNLYPYVWHGKLVRNKYFVTGNLSDSASYSRGFNPAVLSPSVAKVPIVCDEVKVLYTAGFLGARQDPHTLALRPLIGWVTGKPKK